MGKIRLEHLARKMGLPEQDLMFKLRSIGVRIEGEEAEIDSDIIQAILLGKRLPQPREVILRDEPEPEPRRGPGIPKPPPPVRRPSALRPKRRALIQKVENRIQELPVAERQRETGAALEGQESAPVEAVSDTATAAQATTALAEPPATEEKPPAATAQAAAAKAPAAQAEEPAGGQGEPKKAEEVKAKPVATAPAAKPKPKPSTATTPAARASAPSKAAPGKGRPAQPATPPRPQSRPTSPGARRPDPRRPAPPSRAPRPGYQGADKKRVGMVPDPRRGHRARLVELPPTRPAAQKEEPRKPASARGIRRAERREASGDIPKAELQFKDGPPEGPITITEHMTVRDFAEKLGVKA